jgi:5-methylcytosine-specific restriction endonuclease McrA
MCDGCLKRPYTRHKKDKCERCGFVPEHRCQLDVDHIDGDHSNNDPANLQTICANCHRLKSHHDRAKKLRGNTDGAHPHHTPTLFDFTV